MYEFSNVVWYLISGFVFGVPARAAEMAELQSRVNSSESSVEELKKKNAGECQTPVIKHIPTYSICTEFQRIYAWKHENCFFLQKSNRFQCWKIPQWCRSLSAAVSAALAAELPFLQTRLRASESIVDQLRRRNTGHHPQSSRYHWLCVSWH